MIKVKNVSKSFNEQEVLKNINLDLPDKGLVFILGESGSGKTTLLNSIAGLSEYNGSITINGDEVGMLSDNEMSDYRLQNIGFVYQDFKLFSHDSVYDNVVFPLECVSKLSKHYQRRKVEDCLDVVGLTDKLFEKVANLSGGEKQRVAIARAIINDPKLLICDEPTGALDSANKIVIMSILKTISSTRLVLSVSHDEDLAREYGDEVYLIKDGKILKRSVKYKENKKLYLPIYKDEHEKKIPKISTKFLYSHTKNAIKQRKFRSIITNLTVSLGLLGSGLAFMLSDTIYDSVVGMYSNIVSDDEIIVSLKDNNNVIPELKGSNFQDALKIYNENPNDFNGVGVTYLADYESFFKDRNELNLASTSYRYRLPGYSARNINEFKWLDQCNLPIYPGPIDELREDEIIISINPENIRELCYQFRIEKNIESLSKYILENKVLLCFDFANDDWQYYDQQLLQLKGFVLDNKTCIYHSNKLWNEYMFETMMRFPNNSNLSKPDEKPWIMKKITYLMPLNTCENFLEKCLVNDELSSYLFEFANEQFYSKKLMNDECYYNRLLMFDNTFDYLNPNDWKYMKSLQKSIKNPIFSTNSGYSIYGTNILSGFKKMMFFSASKDLLDETTDIFAFNKFDPTTSLELPNGVAQGHYSKTSDDGVFFKGIDGVQFQGKMPENINEIVISKGLANNLFGSENPIGKNIEIALTRDYFDNQESSHNLSFKNTRLNVVGIVDNSKNVLYQNEYWSLLFFQLKLRVSIFELLPFGMSFQIDENITSEDVIKNLSKEFPKYQFDNPLKEIEEQSNSLCNYMRIILFILSILTLIIAICLISICNYLHVIEIKKDIGLLRCIGIREKEAKKMLYFHSLFVAVIAAFTTFVEMVFLYFALGYGMEKLFGITMQRSFSPIPYIIVMGLSLIIGLVPAFITSFKFKNLEPLECIKQ